MKRLASPFVVFAGLALAACGDGTQSQMGSNPAAEPVVLQSSMAGVVKPQTEVVLNTLIAALTEPPDPRVDASKLTDDDWAAMSAAARALRDEAVALRDRPIQVAASPDAKLSGEESLGTQSAADVQGYIDANPEGFSEHAEEMRVKADEWLGAIEARDTANAWRIALELDPVCVECHEVFWSGEPEHHDDH